MSRASVEFTAARAAGGIGQRSAIARGARDGALRRLLAAGDAIAVLVALGFALQVSPAAVGGHSFVWGLMAVPLMLVLFKLYGLYDRDVKRIGRSTVDDLPHLLHATLVGGLILWVYARQTPLHRLDLIEILIFGVLVLLVAPVARSTIRRNASHIIGRERAVMVGGGSLAETLVGKLRAHPEFGLEVAGVLEPLVSDQRSSYSALPVLGTIEQLESVAEERGISRVIISRELDGEELERVLRRCRTSALKVSVLPKLADLLGPAVEVEDIEGLTVLGVNPPWLPRSSCAVKRAMDIVVAGVLLLLGSPFLLLIAALVKLSSPGPVFFSQERVGRAGERFRVLKFRTMVADPEARRAVLLEQSKDPNWLLLDHDPRITRVGRYLRVASLDELPQLWNVLRGEMSLVGPRPLIPSEDERVTGWARGRLDLTPGITGYWQVLGRTRIPFEEMVKLDYLYVMNWSLWEDTRLLLRTLPAVLGGRGVN